MDWTWVSTQNGANDMTCPLCHLTFHVASRMIGFDQYGGDEEPEEFGIEDYPVRCPGCALVFNAGCIFATHGWMGNEYFPVFYKKKNELLYLPGDKTITMAEIVKEYDTVCCCHEWLREQPGVRQRPYDIKRCYSERLHYKAKTVAKVFGEAWAAAFTEETSRRAVKNAKERNRLRRAHNQQ